MNIINEIARDNNLSCFIYTTHNKLGNWFKAKNTNIKRVAKQYQNSLLRYWCYFKFNISTIFSLLLKQPTVVIVFETYSVLPVFVYKSLFKKQSHLYITTNTLV